MATYRFSALADGQAITFRPEQDVLFFDQPNIAAARVMVSIRGDDLLVSVQSGPHAGKDVTLLDTSILQLATSNVRFADGSLLLFGDNTIGTTADDGPNTLTGGAGKDLLDGRGGNDHLRGGAGGDVLFGQSGFDTLDGGSGADTMYGGTENDVYIVNSLGDVVIELEGGGSHDLVRSSVSNYWLPDWVNDLTLTGTAEAGGGNRLDNIIIGNAARNSLYGGGGNDRLEGRDGADVLVGDGGSDTMVGGRHDDWYFVDDPGDVVIELEGGGSRDRVTSTIDYTLPAWVNDLTLLGANRGTGNELDNRIHVSEGAATLDGASGNDTLGGGFGTDHLRGGAGHDSFELRYGEGDVVEDFASRTDRILVDNDIYANLGAEGSMSGDGRFRAGAGLTSARDGSDRIVYNTLTGDLYYDSDGRGGEASLLIATLQGAPKVVGADIIVI